MSQASAILTFTTGGRGASPPAVSAGGIEFAELLTQGLQSSTPANEPPPPREFEDAASNVTESEAASGDTASRDEDSQVAEATESADESPSGDEQPPETATVEEPVVLAVESPKALEAPTQGRQPSGGEPRTPLAETQAAEGDHPKVGEETTAHSDGVPTGVTAALGEEVAETRVSVAETVTSEIVDTPDHFGAAESKKDAATLTAKERPINVGDPNASTRETEKSSDSLAGEPAISASAAGQQVAQGPVDPSGPKTSVLDPEPKSADAREELRDQLRARHETAELSATQPETDGVESVSPEIDHQDGVGAGKDADRGDRRGEKSGQPVRPAPHQAATPPSALLATQVAPTIDSVARADDAEAPAIEGVATDQPPRLQPEAVANPRELNAAATIEATRAQDKAAPGAKVESAPPRGQLTGAQQSRFVQRVAGAVAAAAERGGPLRLRLNPPELGGLQVEVRFSEAGLDVRMEAETPAARAALLDNLPSLREKLARQEVKIERFDVDLMDQRDSAPRDGQARDFGRKEAPRAPRFSDLDRRQVASTTPRLVTGSARVDLFA